MIKALLAILLLGSALVGCSPATGQQDQLPGSALNDPADPLRLSEPRAIRIPSIKVDYTDDWAPLGIQGAQRFPNSQDKTVVPVTSAKGEIEVPALDKPMQPGWFCPTGSPVCGAPTPGDLGPAVVLAHINGKGKQGLFAKLADIKKKDTVEIDRSDGETARFEVYEVQILKKKTFPTQKVYGDTTGPELRLITCGPGKLVTLPDGTRSYENQTIIYAKLLEIKPTV
jgi:hypothetical protein